MVHTTRQRRGYSFEDKIVKELSVDGWQCRRMGGSSANNPDEIATYNDKGIMLIIEAKSTVGQYCYMPVEQIQRFKEVRKMFGYYNDVYFVFAFKFGNKGKRGITKYYYKIYTVFLDNLLELITSIRCDRNGKTQPVFKYKEDKKQGLGQSFAYYDFNTQYEFKTIKDMTRYILAHH